jgi:hypothetical protein
MMLAATKAAINGAPQAIPVHDPLFYSSSQQQGASGPQGQYSFHPHPSSNGKASLSDYFEQQAGASLPVAVDLFGANRSPSYPPTVAAAMQRHQEPDEQALVAAYGSIHPAPVDLSQQYQGPRALSASRQRNDARGKKGTALPPPPSGSNSPPQQHHEIQRSRSPPQSFQPQQASSSNSYQFAQRRQQLLQQDMQVQGPMLMEAPMMQEQHHFQAPPMAQYYHLQQQQQQADVAVPAFIHSPQSLAMQQQQLHQQDPTVDPMLQPLPQLAGVEDVVPFVVMQNQQMQQQRLQAVGITPLHLPAPPPSTGGLAVGADAAAQRAPHSSAAAPYSAGMVIPMSRNAMLPIASSMPAPMARQAPVPASLPPAPTIADSLGSFLGSSVPSPSRNAVLGTTTLQQQYQQFREGLSGPGFGGVGLVGRRPGAAGIPSVTPGRSNPAVKAPFVIPPPVTHYHGGSPVHQQQQQFQGGQLGRLYSPMAAAPMPMPSSAMRANGRRSPSPVAMRKKAHTPLQASVRSPSGVTPRAIVAMRRR